MDCQVCGIALCGEADLVGLARTRVIFYLTPRWTDRRSLKILIARVEFFFSLRPGGNLRVCKGFWFGELHHTVFCHSRYHSFGSQWFVWFVWGFLVDRQFIPNSNCSHLAFFEFSFKSKDFVVALLFGSIRTRNRIRSPRWIASGLLRTM